MFNQQKDYRRKKFFILPFLIVAAVLLFGGTVMLLWNAILPPVLGVAALTYWQAVGLLVLSRILFGGLRGGGRPPAGGRWSGKWMNMTEEERARLKEEWRDRCKKRTE